MTTIRMKAADIVKEWHVVDAAGRPLGRVASEVARLLRGKHKPTFEPHLDGGDFVVVVNASKVQLTGKKRQTKVYYRHSGYLGNLRVRSFEEELAKHPERVIKRAVWGMLPKNSLGERMLKHLKVYPGPDHPHQAQIIGSERARERRAAELQARIEAEEAKKPPRLRPLSGRVEVAEPGEAVEAAAAAAEAPPAEAPAVEVPAQEQPGAEAQAAATAEAPAKRSRGRRAAKSEEAGSEASDAPSGRRRRTKKSAEPEASSAGEEA